ncbi:MAG: L-histidine N(alpha)-methyltransferase [bacterium]|nr:MAG: L-histidine N(alpha)-methyltransferase [bacterium]
MPSPTAQDRSTMIITDMEDFTDSFVKDVDNGLNDIPKHIPCVYFYDYTGSILFEKICQLPEYYLTQAETEILESQSKRIITTLPDNVMLVELGSGSSVKTRLIIEALLSKSDKLSYSPIDISRKMLHESSISLLERYDNLEIISVAATYEEGLRKLTIFNEQAKLILWLGSSIGNFRPAEASRFLGNIAATMKPEDCLLIGFDLVKEKRILEKAYNDSQNVTAEFNLNLLSRINRELGGEFDLGRFTHQALYNEEERRIEMYLISNCEQNVYISAMNRSYHFGINEMVHTENSCKYSPEAIGKIANRAGLQILEQWFDSRHYFNLTLFKPDNR